MIWVRMSSIWWINSKVLLFLFLLLGMSTAFADKNLDANRRIIVNSNTGEEVCFYCRRAPVDCQCHCNCCGHRIRGVNQSCQCHIAQQAESLCGDCLYPGSRCEQHHCRSGLINTQGSLFTPPPVRRLMAFNSMFFLEANSVVQIVGPPVAQLAQNQQLLTQDMEDYQYFSEPCDTGNDYNCLHYRVDEGGFDPFSDQVTADQQASMQTILNAVTQQINSLYLNTHSFVLGEFQNQITELEPYSQRYFLLRVRIYNTWHIAIVMCSHIHFIMFYLHQKVLHVFHNHIQAFNEFYAKQQQMYLQSMPFHPHDKVMTIVLLNAYLHYRVHNEVYIELPPENSHLLASGNDDNGESGSETDEQEDCTDTENESDSSSDDSENDPEDSDQ